MTSSRWIFIGAGAALVLGAVLLGLIAAVPEFKGETDWTGQLSDGGWMAWSFPVALFFWIIAGTLVVFTLLALRFPETPRKGILGIYTTRGDRLFITLLGSAFINIAWLGLTDQPQWQALGVCLVWAIAVFRFV